jgi:hypothetical protein
MCHNVYHRNLHRCRVCSLERRQASSNRTDCFTSSVLNKSKCKEKSYISQPPHATPLQRTFYSNTNFSAEVKRQAPVWSPKCFRCIFAYLIILTFSQDYLDQGGTNRRLEKAVHWAASRVAGFTKMGRTYSTNRMYEEFIWNFNPNFWTKNNFGGTVRS